MSTRKMLIALQFWEGDRDASIRLAQYLAQLQEGHSNQADLLLVSRFDCPFNEGPVLASLSRKFNVTHYRSPRRGIGWPHGCNELWFATMEWVFSMMEAKRVPNYKCVFTCEGDGAPVFNDWIARMSAAWDKTQAGPNRVYIAGALTEPGPHINGNCLVSTDRQFMTWLVRRVGGCHVTVGWDYLYRDDFKRWGWANIPGVKSYYNTKHFTEQQFAKMRADDLIWVHGDKSGCLIDYGLKMYGP